MGACLREWNTVLISMCRFLPILNNPITSALTSLAYNRLANKVKFETNTLAYLRRALVMDTNSCSVLGSTDEAKKVL